ncbi:methyltransferase family protein [candidate division KSB1 bacterium]
MRLKSALLLVLLIITALVISFPKPEDAFTGILIAILGFTILNAYPFVYRFDLSKITNHLAVSGTFFCILYGWSSIISSSGFGSPGLFRFIGSFIILISITGLILTLADWFGKIKTEGFAPKKLYTKGMFSLVRHPQTFLGMLFLFGLIIYESSLILLITSPLWIVGFISYAAFEEKYDLVPRFEKEYLDYCEETPGLLPNKSSFNKFMKQYN